MLFHGQKSFPKNDTHYTQASELFFVPFQIHFYFKEKKKIRNTMWGCPYFSPLQITTELKSQKNCLILERGFGSNFYLCKFSSELKERAHHHSHTRPSRPYLWRSEGRTTAAQGATNLRRKQLPGAKCVCVGGCYTPPWSRDARPTDRGTDSPHTEPLPLRRSFQDKRWWSETVPVLDNPFPLFGFFKTDAHYEPQAALQLKILLPQSPEGS